MTRDEYGARTARTLGIGVLGFGGFGMFAAQQFAQVPGAKLVCLAGTHREAAVKAAERFVHPDVKEQAAMLAMAEVDIVYIATPPFLHYEQSLAALRAGKHVIVEKPLAMTAAQDDELVALAEAEGLLMTTNLIAALQPAVRAGEEARRLERCSKTSSRFSPIARMCGRSTHATARHPFA